MELLRMSPQKTGPTSEKSQGNGHPVLFGFDPAYEFDPFPDGGGYPIRFMELAYSTLGVTDPTRVLHMCSGSTRVGVRVDIRHAMSPTVVGDVRRLPFADRSFDWIMADPPYSEDWATNLYGTGKDYPTPGAIMAEACRVLRPGGMVGLLHFMVPMIRKPLSMVGVWGVSTGSGYAIRAWTVCQKEQDRLFA